MIKLDLHGTKHWRVRQRVINLIEDFWGQEKELQIITGYSTHMKEEVIKVIEEYKLSYTIGDILGLNRGYILVKL